LIEEESQPHSFLKRKKIPIIPYSQKSDLKKSKKYDSIKKHTHIASSGFFSAKSFSAKEFMGPLFSKAED